MTTIAVTIKNKKAEQLLENLASLDLIELGKRTTKPSLKSRKEKTQTHFASEKTLAKEWNTKQEDEAWQSL